MLSGRKSWLQLGEPLVLRGPVVPCPRHKLLLGLIAVELKKISSLSRSTTGSLSRYISTCTPTASLLSVAARMVVLYRLKVLDFKVRWLKPEDSACICHKTQHMQYQPNHLFPKLFKRHVFVTILLHDLSNRHFEVFLSDMYSALPQCEHPSFGAACFQLCTRGSLQ